MIINNVVLNNFGIYYGETKYDFSIEEDKNIVLISGKNGSGKTTLLNAIKLGIYGPVFLGYQTYNDKYYDYIESKLNAFALDEQQENYSICIDLRFLEKGKYSNYNINRAWAYNNGKLKETLKVLKDNLQLEQREIFDFFNSLHTFMPSSLFDLFFFDGEKIEKLFLLKNGSTDIMQFLDMLFNLDLFNNLDKDLVKYLKQKNVFETLDIREKEELELTTKKEEVENKIRNYSEEIVELQENINRSKDDLHKIEEDFKMLGGLEEEEYSKIRTEINELEQQRDRMLSFNRNIVLEQLPFLILKRKINRLSVSMNTEKNIKSNNLVKDKLNDPGLKNYVSDILTVNSNLDQLLNAISNYFSKDGDDSLIYNLSKEDEYAIESLVKEINEIDLEQFKINFKVIREYNDKILETRKKLEDSLNNEFSEKVKAIKELQSSMSVKEEQINIKKQQLSELLHTIEVLDNSILKIRSEIKNAKKDENVFSVVFKINNVIRKYTERIKSDKLKAMEDYVTEIFNMLIRKDDFIRRIHIDSITSEINLINKLNKVMPEDNLSAGEKQIYVLSLLWAMINVSDRRIPLVFDTLLGRLDKSHKSNIVSNFLPTCGEQVIILATDSEIDDEYYELLNPFISKYYKIDYDSIQNKVAINHY